MASHWNISFCLTVFPVYHLLDSRHILGLCKVNAAELLEYLFHVSGKIRWHIYKEWAPASKKDKIAARTDNLTIDKEFELDDGDMLYIPKHLYHRVTTLSPRISISFHFNEFGESHNRYNRDPWLNWIPQGIYGNHNK